MPHLPRYLLSKITLILLATLLSSCGGGSGDDNAPVEPAVTSWNEFNWDEKNWE